MSGEDLIVNPRVRIPASELLYKAVRSSGPGGQNVNKVSSKVELRFDARTSVALRADVRVRLLALAANKLDRDGAILITSQLTRDQPQNREDARSKLKALIEQALFVPRARKKTKPSRAAKERRLDTKRKTSERKQARRSPDE